jgi:uncharacterized protein
MYDIFIQHAQLVAEKALNIARRVPHLNPDMTFIREAAMLHDIAIFMTDAPGIDCHGQYPYVCHGYLGRELLDNLGFPKHGLVCERHVGVGITLEDIRRNNLPIPHREMVPMSIEEKIVCYADKFYSKNPNLAVREKTVGEIRKNLIKSQSLIKYGSDPAARFDAWVNLFEEAGHE